MSFALKTTLSLTMLLCASITALHAYEQNGYVIFEFVEKVTNKTAQTNLVRINSGIFDSTKGKSTADTGIALKNSEFLMDITPTLPESSTFSDSTIVPDEVIQATPETSSSFGTPSTSAFGEPKKSVFGE